MTTTIECGICHEQAPSRTMSTNVPGTSTVTIIDCPRCDHRQCAKCQQPVAHTSTTCPSGHRI